MTSCSRFVVDCLADHDFCGLPSWSKLVVGCPFGPDLFWAVMLVQICEGCLAGIKDH